MKKYCEGKVKRTLKRGSKALEIVVRKAYATIDCLRRVQRSRTRCVFPTGRKRSCWGRRSGLVCSRLARAYQRRVLGVHEGGSKVLRGVRFPGTYRFLFRDFRGLVKQGAAFEGSRTAL